MEQINASKESLSDKILSVVYNELSKPDTKRKVSEMTGHVSSYIMKQIHPYVLSIIIIMLLILFVQIYVLSKLMDLQAHFR